jgi:hypothetical protein
MTTQQLEAYESGFNVGRELGERACLSPFMPFSDEDIAWRLGVLAAFIKEAAINRPVNPYGEGDPAEISGT